jgi:hypothetical protein
LRVREELSDTLFEAITEDTDVDAYIVQFLAYDATCLAKADDSGDIFSAGAQLILLPAAKSNWGDVYAFTDKESAHAFGSVHFLRGNRYEVTDESGNVDLNFAYGLRGINVNKGAPTCRDRG